jgi:hypothetical protein
MRGMSHRNLGPALTEEVFETLGFQKDLKMPWGRNIFQRDNIRKLQRNPLTMLVGM